MSEGGRKIKGAMIEGMIMTTATTTMLVKWDVFTAATPAIEIGPLDFSSITICDDVDVGDGE